MKLSAILIALPLVIGTASCKQQPKQSAEKVANTETKTSNNNNSGKEKKMEVQEMTAQMFKEKVMNYEKNPNTWVFEGDKPVLIDFYATWCGPCKAMKPILEELKGIKGEKVRIVKVDVDKHKEIAAYYQIQSVPTLMIFKDGKQLWRQSGVMRANDLSTILAQYE